MEYKIIIALSYSVVLVVMAVILSRKLLLMSGRLFDIAGREKARRFLWGRLPSTVLVLLWSTFLTGSVVACVFSAIAWLIK